MSHYKKGLWTVEEDEILMDYIRVHGKGRWNRVAKMTGLKRCGKSCRLRWMNYLSPSVKRGDFSEEEEDLIIRLHNLLGNRWSLIAGRVPGRTDNQVKNYWNTHLSKKLGLKMGKNKVGVSSLTDSRDCRNGMKTLKHTRDSNVKSSTFNDNGGAIVERTVNEGFQSAAETSNVQESVPSEGFESSFWFSIDNLNPNTFSSREFLDEYPFDEVWQGL